MRFLRRHRLTEDEILKLYIRDTIMSLLQDQMPAALAELKAELGATAPTADQITTQVHAIIDPQITDLKTNIETILASEKDDAGKIADLTAVANQFITAFTPTAPVTTGSTSTPAAGGTTPTGGTTPAAPTGDATPTPAA